MCCVERVFGESGSRERHVEFQFRIAFTKSLFVLGYLVSMVIRGAILALFSRLPSRRVSYHVL